MITLIVTGSGAAAPAATLNAAGKPSIAAVRITAAAVEPTNTSVSPIARDVGNPAAAFVRTNTHCAEKFRRPFYQNFMSMTRGRGAGLALHPADHDEDQRDHQRRRYGANVEHVDIGQNRRLGRYHLADISHGLAG